MAGAGTRDSGSCVLAPALPPMRVGASNEGPLDKGTDSATHSASDPLRERWLDIPTGRIKESTVVFADCWPEWLPVLPALGFWCSKVYCGGHAGRYRKWFSQDPGAWTSVEQATWSRLRDQQITTAFVSRSLDFV